MTDGDMGAGARRACSHGNATQSASSARQYM
jgi:hypothetical protein